MIGVLWVKNKIKDEMSSVNPTVTNSGKNNPLFIDQLYYSSKQYSLEANT